MTLRPMWLVGVLICQILYPIHAAMPFAHVTVRGDGPLDVATLRNGSLIHPNRPYTFGRVLPDVIGLSYLRHEHRNAARVHCTVTKDGRIVVCLWGPTEPTSLHLPGQWTRCGTMTESTGTDKWTIWERQARQNDTFVLPVVDRWGAVVVAADIQIRHDPAAEVYDRIEKEIALVRSLHKDRLQQLVSQSLRPDAMILPEDRDPLDVLLRRTAALLKHLRQVYDTPNLTELGSQLEHLTCSARQTDPGNHEMRYEMFRRAAQLRRRITLANPLLDFDRIVFLTHHRARYEHMVDQYYGFHAQPGGGLYVLEDAFGSAPRARNLLADVPVKRGRLAGRPLQEGSFISLELSFDARTLAFAWTEAQPTVNQWTPQSTYHVFCANVDGTGLMQLTDGVWNEFDPCFMPDGRIVFISERRGGYLRCSGRGGRPNPTYTLFQMDADGQGVRPLSYHETHEWHPSVDHQGMLVYTRWDYVDRDSDIAHHIWTSYPDGHDPRSYHGNYPDVREHRPWMEMSIRSVPGSAKYVAVAAPHHGQAYGSLVLIDPRLDDDRAMSQLRRITPLTAFPESEGKPYRAYQIYGSPWPLSEDFYLCVFDPGASNYGIYLVDSFGSRELLWRDSTISCLDPIPLRPRPRPPVIPSPKDPSLVGSGRGSVAVTNVYDSDSAWPPNTRITALRIIQIFPKATPREYEPNIGVGRQSLARGVLGTVPVEPDGSVHFEMPAGVPVYFQALDDKGLAVQTMRSDTYVHEGRRLVCQGCHEPKRRIAANRPTGSVQALRRAPSKLQPGPPGSYPLTFPALVQRVLNHRCADCHAKHPTAPDLSAQASGEFGWSGAYQTLAPFAWAKHGGNGSIRLNGTSYSIPGRVGARASKLHHMLTAGSHADRVTLDAEEMQRITLWLDCNSNFYGAYHDLAAQVEGHLVTPSLQ